jgi:hypothetical protein
MHGGNGYCYPESYNTSTKGAVGTSKALSFACWLSRGLKKKSWFRHNHSMRHHRWRSSGFVGLMVDAGICGGHRYVGNPYIAMPAWWTYVVGVKKKVLWACKSTCIFVHYFSTTGRVRADVP